MAELATQVLYNQNFPWEKSSKDNDFVDRLNHKYTINILQSFAVMMFFTNYLLEPIRCWWPYTTEENHESYMDRICWISNTYHLPIQEKRTLDAEEPRQRIGYYQWVPLILLCQAALFYLPGLLWQLMNRQAAVDLDSIVSNSIDLQKNNHFQNRKKYIGFIAQNLNHHLQLTRRYRPGCMRKCRQFSRWLCCPQIGRRYGNFLGVTYIFVKVLYVINIMAQMYLIGILLGNNYYLYGYQIVVKAIHGQKLVASEIFPRVTICDFYVRQLGNIHRHTVQCVLPHNFFSEAVYVVIWFWYIFVALVTVINVSLWTFRLAFRGRRLRYIGDLLRKLRNNVITERNERDDDDDSVMDVDQPYSEFVSDYLRCDGVFILRLVATNANEMIVGEIVDELWSSHRIRRSSRELLEV